MDAYVILSITLIRVVLAALLLTSGLIKLATPKQTSEIVQQYGLKREIPALIAGLVLAVIEIIVAILLLLFGYSHIVPIATTLLFASFLSVIILNLSRKEKIPCGCFGRFSQEPINWLTATRAGLFLIAAMALTATTWRITKADTDLFVSIIIVIGALSATLGIILVFLTTKSSPKKTQTRDERGINDFDRRNVLKGMGAAIFSTIIVVNRWRWVEAGSCCHCQTYDHYENSCCSFPNEDRMHHFFKRCCNSCTGGWGYWHLQWETCDFTCPCGPGDPPCDVIHSCTGGGCYMGDCCAV